MKACSELHQTQTAMFSTIFPTIISDDEMLTAPHFMRFVFKCYFPLGRVFVDFESLARRVKKCR